MRNLIYFSLLLTCCGAILLTSCSKGDVLEIEKIVDSTESSDSNSDKLNVEEVNNSNGARHVALPFTRAWGPATYADNGEGGSVTSCWNQNQTLCAIVWDPINPYDVDEDTEYVEAGSIRTYDAEGSPIDNEFVDMYIHTSANDLKTFEYQVID